MKEEIINKLKNISTQLWTLGQEAVEDIPKISEELSERIDDVITDLGNLEVTE